MKKYGPWVLFLIAMAGWTFQNYQLGDLQRELTLAEANTRAALDTTRVSAADSVTAATRLANQASIENDSLSGALAAALADRGATLRTLQRTRVRIDSLVALGQTATTDTIIVTATDTVRVASFELEGPPISGAQTVRVGPAITLDSRLVVTPFTVSYGVACAGSDAVFSWDTPDWVSTTFESGAVDPLVCNPLPRASMFSISTGKSFWLVAGGLLGYVLGSH